MDVEVLKKIKATKFGNFAELGGLLKQSSKAAKEYVEKGRGGTKVICDLTISEKL